MLTVEVTDIMGEVTRHTPVKFDMVADEDVPADDIVVHLKGVGFREFVSVRVFYEGKLIFSGEVDEQIDVQARKSYTEITVRDTCARLIDNEAYPMSFLNPSAYDIFECYAKPLGFKFMEGENKALSGRFTVEKGISCYTAIRRFAQLVYSAFPKCREDTLLFEGIKSDGVLHIGKEGISPIDMRVAQLRCNRVSRVYLKHKEGGGYDSFISDAKAEADGIRKVRYINLASGNSGVEEADIIFDEAEKNSFYADVALKGFYGDALGKKVIFDYCDTEFYVSSVRYSADDKNEFTRLRVLYKGAK